MNEVIDKLQNMSFVTGLRNISGKEINSNRHLIIDISKKLIIKEDTISNLYDLLKSQSHFEWTVNLNK